MIPNQPNPAHLSHCFNCGRCFCGVAKTSTSDNKTICVICKPSYEAKLKTIKG